MKIRPLLGQNNLLYRRFRKKSKNWINRNLLGVNKSQIEEILIKGLEEDEKHKRFGSIYEIREQFKKSLAMELCSLLREENFWRNKWLAVITLGEFGAFIEDKEQLIETLLPIYDSDKKRKWLRIRVVESIGKIGLNIEKSEIKKEEIIKWLVDKLDENHNWRVRREAALSLGKIAKQEEIVFDSLINTLEGKNEQKHIVREQAGFSLGQIGSKLDKVKIKHIKSIIDILKKDKNDLIKAACAFALGESHIDNQKSINMILSALKEVYPNIKNRKAQFYLNYAQAVYEGEDSESKKLIDKMISQSRLESRELLIYERLKFISTSTISGKIVKGILTDGIWTKKIATGWIVNGIFITDIEAPKLFSDMLRTNYDRRITNGIVYCILEMGNRFRKDVCKHLLVTLDNPKYLSAKGSIIYKIGKLRCNDCVEILIKKMKVESNSDLKFEYARTIARIENNLINDGSQEILKIFSTLPKWSDASASLLNKLVYELEGTDADIRSVQKQFLVDKNLMEQPITVFISYSKGEKLEKWIEKLVDKLMENNIYPAFDEWDVRFGDYFNDFMNKIEETDFTLMIFTPGYIKKLKRDYGGVSYERRLIESQIIDGKEPKRIIPIVKDKSIKDKIPHRFKQKKYCDMSTPAKFKKNLELLIKHIKDN